MRAALQTRTVRSSVIVVRLLARGEPNYMLVRTGKLDGWSLPAGRLRSDEHPDWHKIAARGAEEQLAPLRFGEDFFLTPLTETPLRWTSRSKTGIKTSYQAQVFGLRFVRPADKYLARLPHGVYRLVAHAEVGEFQDDVLSAVLKAVPDAPLSEPTGAARPTPSLEPATTRRTTTRTRPTPPVKTTVAPTSVGPEGIWTAGVIARMGADTDTEIARDLNVTISAVAQQRRKRGIARSPKAALQPHSWSEKEDRLLGSMTDGELAEELDVSKASIERRRVQLGVPPYNGKSTRRLSRRLGGARYAADHEAGTPIVNIARKHKKAAATVRKALQRYLARVQTERGDQPVTSAAKRGR